MIKFEKLEEKFQIKIKNKNLWLEALTHKSWLFFHPDKNLRHNERLEFFGDAVIELVISWYLWQHYQDKEEGDLTLIRSELVSRDHLGAIAENLGLANFVLVGKNVKDKGLKTVLGNSLEAIAGAFFIDQGLEKAKEFIETNFLIDLNKIIETGLYKDPKSTLQEIFQEKFEDKPIYQIIEESGPAHQKKFKAGVFYKNQLLSKAEGESKQEAEEKAALKILTEQTWKKIIK